MKVIEIYGKSFGSLCGLHSELSHFLNSYGTKELFSNIIFESSFIRNKQTFYVRECLFIIYFLLDITHYSVQFNKI